MYFKQMLFTHLKFQRADILLPTSERSLLFEKLTVMAKSSGIFNSVEEDVRVGDSSFDEIASINRGLERLGNHLVG